MSDVQVFPKPGEHYRHYKGGTYVIVCLSKHHHTGHIWIVYQELCGAGRVGAIYHRPFDPTPGEEDCWTEPVPVDGGFVPRFTLLPSDGGVRGPGASEARARMGAKPIPGEGAC